MRQHGGQNRRCDQLEDRQRIDSFQLRYKAFQIGKFELLPFATDGNFVKVDGECIQLSYIYNAAGNVPFFRCPKCGQRVRFLYLPLYLCRYCSRLNYRSQQATKGSFSALAAIPKKLDSPPPAKTVDEAAEYQLTRPPYMRKKRFARYQERFLKHQRQYVQMERRRLFRILRQSEIGREYLSLLGVYDKNR